MLRRTIETLGAGIAVYVLMAACSGSGGAGQPQAAAGSSSVAGSDGSGGLVGTGGEPGDAGMMADVMNPVPDAMAAAGAGNGDCGCEPYVPPEPTVVTADCDIEGSNGSMFAEVAFPGRTKEQLATVHVVVTYPTDIADRYPASALAGYDTQLSTLFVRDGYVATNCGSIASNFVGESVTFVLP